MDLTEAVERLRGSLPSVPDVALVLGSGLGHVVDRIERPISSSFEDLPGLPSSTVAGHAGRFVHGTLGGREVLIQAGRYHLYEGHPTEVVVAPVRVLARLGVRTFVFTNASGGIRPSLEPGDFVLVDDHLNLMFRSPLAGPVAPGETRFPDMSAPYDPELQEAALRAAARVGIALTRGTYAGVLGPAFETAAEVRMLARLGADVVGMSTVPEVVTARALGLRCLAVSMVTNRATGLGGGALSHEEVMEVGRVAGLRLGDFVLELLAELDATAQSTGAK